MLILVRTAPLEAGKKPTDGLSLFYTALDRRFIEVREIEKMGRKAVDSNLLFIDGLEVPVEDRIGEEGRGFEYILHGMNPERILIAAEAVGLGRVALKRARADRIRSPDRQKSSYPTPAGGMLDGTGSSQSHGFQGRAAI
jgi:acyl-CoA dehydrogenase